jgi:hypothetical protein
MTGWIRIGTRLLPLLFAPLAACQDASESRLFCAVETEIVEFDALQDIQVNFLWRPPHDPTPVREVRDGGYTEYWYSQPIQTLSLTDLFVIHDRRGTGFGNGIATPISGVPREVADVVSGYRGTTEAGQINESVFQVEIAANSEDCALSEVVLAFADDLLHFAETGEHAMQIEGRFLSSRNVYVRGAWPHPLDELERIRDVIFGDISNGDCLSVEENFDSETWPRGLRRERDNHSLTHFAASTSFIVQFSDETVFESRICFGGRHRPVRRFLDEYYACNSEVPGACAPMNGPMLNQYVQGEIYGWESP